MQEGATKKEVSKIVCILPKESIVGRDFVAKVRQAINWEIISSRTS